MVTGTARGQNADLSIWGGQFTFDKWKYSEEHGLCALAIFYVKVSQ
jgi:hypothetical protein